MLVKLCQHRFTMKRNIPLLPFRDIKYLSQSLCCYQEGSVNKCCIASKHGRSHTFYNERKSPPRICCVNLKAPTTGFFSIYFNQCYSCYFETCQGRHISEPVIVGNPICFFHPLKFNISSTHPNQIEKDKHPLCSIPR